MVKASHAGNSGTFIHDAQDKHLPTDDFKYHTTINALYTCVHTNVCKYRMKNNFHSLLVAERLNEILILEYMF